jgi:hypothetical protein
MYIHFNFVIKVKEKEISKGMKLKSIIIKFIILTINFIHSHENAIVKFIILIFVIYLSLIKKK